MAAQQGGGSAAAGAAVGEPLGVDPPGPVVRPPGPPGAVLPRPPSAAASSSSAGIGSVEAAGSRVRPGSEAVRVPENRKSRRVEGAGAPLLELAQERMVGTFGQQWRTMIHHTHRLSLADPLLYCRICGHHCESRQHLVGLKKPCDGTATGSYPARLRRIEGGSHPLRGHALGRAVPLPPGSRT